MGRLPLDGLSLAVAGVRRSGGVFGTGAGILDPKQDVEFYVGTPTIPNAPGEGEYIMIVLKDGHFIVSDECEFMPHGLPLVVIDGLGDPRVHDTLKKARDARAHPLQG
jgi:hypothetical protein